MIETAFKCDMPDCKRTKGEGNHWLMYKITKPGVFLIRAWSKEFEPDKTWGHLCSDQCAIRLMVKTVRGNVITSGLRNDYVASYAPQTMCEDCEHRSHAMNSCRECDLGTGCNPSVTGGD